MRKIDKVKESIKREIRGRKLNRELIASSNLCLEEIENRLNLENRKIAELENMLIKLA